VDRPDLRRQLKDPRVGQLLLGKLADRNVILQEEDGAAVGQVELAAKVRAVHDPARPPGPGLGRRARVEVRLKDGTTLSAVGTVRGGAENPVTRADVEAKFRKLTHGVLDAAGQDRLIAACDRLDLLADSAELTALLEIPAPKPDAEEVLR